MKISEKIEQIRQEPEHIRLRYVWGAVAVSMFFIIAIWIFSIGTLFQGDKNNADQKNSTSSITDQLKTIRDQAPSIKDFTDPSSEGVSSKSQVPTDSTQATQSDSYSSPSITSLSQ